MDTNKQLQKRPWIIAGLLMLTLLSTAMTGCRHHQAVSGTVNSTFVDVDGLLAAPTRITTSYPTEELNMGNDNSAGIPQFLDGTLYTFSYHSDLNQWTTAWDQATGKKLWSIATNASVSMPPYTTFTTDGKHLFFVRADMFKSGEPGVVASIACLDKTTGATLWQRTPTVASPFVFGVHSNIAVHINEQSHTADRVYVIAEEEQTSTSVPTTEEVHYPGIWIWDATTGASLDRIDWTALSTLSGNGGQLLCDGTTLYVSIPKSTEAEYPTWKSSLVAFDLTTNKVLWQQGIDGEGANLVKQGNMLIFVRSAMYSDEWIDVWQINAHGATRLWTRQAEGAPEEGPRTSLAVDGSRIYLQGSKGIFRALDLASGKEVWKHQFAPTKGPITDGPDVGKLHDTYPSMTLTTTRNVLYVQDGGGLVAVFDPATGKELWNKRISNVQIGQTHASGMYVLQLMDKGFLVIASDGKVDLWQ